MSSTPTTNKQRRGKALPALLILCVVLGIALPVSRKLLFHKPAPPVATADMETKRRYWKDRIRRDVADKEAYLQLGILEERATFYLSARRNLEAARAIGVPDAQVSGPLGRVFTQLGLLDLAEVELKKSAQLAPDSLEATLNLAGFFVNARQSKEARALLIDFWKRQQGALSSLQKERFALAAQEAGDIRLAREAVVKALASDPTSKTALMIAARSSLTLNEVADARRYVELALKGDENVASVQYFYGLVLRRLGDHDGALRAWQRANAVDPTLMDVYVGIADEYARRNDFKRAAFAIERVALNTNDSDAVVKTITAYRKAGEPLRAAYWEAVAVGFYGDFSRSLELGKQAASSPDPSVRRRGQSAMVEAYRGLNKKAEALKLVEEMSVKRTPSDLSYLVKTYEALNQYEKYIATLKELIQKDPSREATVGLELATTLAKTGRREDAEKEHQRLAKKYPQNADVLLEMAMFYLKASSVGDNLTEATRLSKEAVGLSPTDEKSWRILGQCYAASGQLGAAAQCLEHAIDLEPGRGPTYMELSRVYARAGNASASQEMRKLYQKFVAFEQERSSIELRAHREQATAADLVAYGDLKLNMEDSEEAIRAYERALQMEPRNKQIRTTLSQMYQRFNMPDRLAGLVGLQERLK